MSQDSTKHIGLIIGREKDWPEAFMTAVNDRNAGVTAELVMLGGTRMNQEISYDLIIDRMSHEIPYYREYLKYAALYGCQIINNPYTWSIDSRFFSMTLVHRLGLTCPRTVALPNKDIEQDTVPANFRNLEYPMDWQGIIDYVGVPAIFKDVRSGGRRHVHRVHSIDELIQRYDESGTRSMILQEVIESDTHVHVFVVGQEQVMSLRYALADGKYEPEILSSDTPIVHQIEQDAIKLTQAYGYEVNMLEFVIKDDTAYVINSTNPAPVMDKELMTPAQFEWCVNTIADMAIDRAKHPPANSGKFQFFQVDNS